MGLGTHAFSLITTSFLLSTLPACTTCVESGDQPEPRAQRTAQKRSASNRAREKLQRHTLQTGGAQRRYLVQTPRDHEQGKRAPLLVLFTATGQTPERFTDRKNIMIGAAKLGYLLAVPAARGPWKHELCPSSGAGAVQVPATQAESSPPGKAVAAPAVAAPAVAAFAQDT